MEGANIVQSETIINTEKAKTPASFDTFQESQDAHPSNPKMNESTAITAPLSPISSSMSFLDRFRLDQIKSQHEVMLREREDVKKMQTFRKAVLEYFSSSSSSSSDEEGENDDDEESDMALELQEIARLRKEGKLSVDKEEKLIKEIKEQRKVRKLNMIGDDEKKNRAEEKKKKEKIKQQKQLGTLDYDSFLRKQRKQLQKSKRKEQAVKTEQHNYRRVVSPVKKEGSNAVEDTSADVQDFYMQQKKMTDATKTKEQKARVSMNLGVARTNMVEETGGDVTTITKVLGKESIKATDYKEKLVQKMPSKPEKAPIAGIKIASTETHGAVEKESNNKSTFNKGGAVKASTVGSAIAIVASIDTSSTSSQQQLVEKLISSEALTSKSEVAPIGDKAIHDSVIGESKSDIEKLSSGKSASNKGDAVKAAPVVSAVAIAASVGTSSQPSKSKEDWIKMIKSSEAATLSSLQQWVGELSLSDAVTSKSEITSIPCDKATSGPTINKNKNAIEKESMDKSTYDNGGAVKAASAVSAVAIAASIDKSSKSSMLTNLNSIEAATSKSEITSIPDTIATMSDPKIDESKNAVQKDSNFNPGGEHDVDKPTTERIEPVYVFDTKSPVTQSVLKKDELYAVGQDFKLITDEDKMKEDKVEKYDDVEKNVQEGKVGIPQGDFAEEAILPKKRKISSKIKLAAIFLFVVGGVLAVVGALVLGEDSNGGNSSSQISSPSAQVVPSAPETRSPTMSPIDAFTQIEIDVLSKLYTSNDGKNWLDNTDWLSNQSVCSWYGVQCDDEHGHIFRIDLRENNLQGSGLVSELGLLAPYLEILYLQDNKIEGKIPSEFGLLTNLRKLYLFANSISGTIPTELGNMELITHLLLDFNAHTGTIPSELGRMSLMTRLDVPYNLLTGTIPSELGNMVGATTIYGQQNFLTGTVPSEVCNNANINGGQLKTFILDCKTEIVCECCSLCV